MEFKIIMPNETDYEWGHPSHLTREYLDKHAVGDVFVETGTYMGDTVRLALDYGFQEIHTIELNDELYAAAVEMFKDEHRVKIWHGDSYRLMPEIVDLIGDRPATFWLDAHASGPLPGGETGGSPVVTEIQAIAKSPFKGHTIFIDDKRLFGSAEWSHVSYNDALDALRQVNQNYQIILYDGHVPQDVICATVRS